jgi:prepilin-type N-terminal cleavage/methylation domain-containing protein
MRQARHSSRDARGFTLTEVLIALAVGLIAMVGVIAVFASGVRSRRRAVDGMEAAVIAESLVAEARSVFTDRGTPVPAKDRKWPGKPRYTCDVDYVQLDAAGDELLMVVSVRWFERGRPVPPLRFETIILRKMD